jgi:hypothetical protein
VLIRQVDFEGGYRETVELREVVVVEFVGQDGFDNQQLLRNRMVSFVQ